MDKLRELLELQSALRAGSNGATGPESRWPSLGALLNWTHDADNDPLRGVEISAEKVLGFIQVGLKNHELELQCQAQGNTLEEALDSLEKAVGDRATLWRPYKTRRPRFQKRKEPRRP